MLGDLREVQVVQRELLSSLKARGSCPLAVATDTVLIEDCALWSDRGRRRDRGWRLGKAGRLTPDGQRTETGGHATDAYVFLCHPIALRFKRRPDARSTS
jgi:hypothetical protein